MLLEREKATPSEWDQIKLIQDSSLRVLAILVQWFTWFFGTELISLGWIVGQIQPAKYLPIIATLWIFCSLLGIGATIILAIYLRDVLRQIKLLWIQIYESDDKKQSRPDVLVSRWLYSYAPFAMTLALISGIAAWVALLMHK